MSSVARARWLEAGGKAPDDWDFYSIEELLATPKSIAVGVMYPGQNTPGGVPLVKVADVKAGRVTDRPNFSISVAKDEEYKRTRLVGNELLITLVGNPGDCVLVKPHMIGWNVARAIAMVRFRDPNLREWVRYSLLSRPAQNFLSSRFNTTVQKTLNLKDVRELGIPIPAEGIRQRITSFLTSLDDQIELNREINTTLESMAQALFKSWFVDFDPVIDNALAAGNDIPEPLQAKAERRKSLGDKRKPLPDGLQQQFPDRFVFTEEMGWVPEGWRVQSLEAFIELAYGKSLPAKIRVEGLVPVYGSGGVSGTHNEALVQGPGIVVGRKGTVGSLYWIEGPFFPIDTVFYVVPKTDEIPLYWIYQALQQIDIQSMGADSAVPGVNRNTLYASKVVCPDSCILNSYWKVLCVLVERESAIEGENLSLSKLRDTLLPKLLSGELQVPDAEKLVAEAV